MRFLLLLVPLLVVVRSEGDCCDGCDCDDSEGVPNHFAYEVAVVREEVTMHVTKAQKNKC